MKRTIALAGLALLFIGMASAQQKVSILGDSYSTFRGHIPEGYAVWYPMNGNDVKTVEQTWWYKFINDNEGYVLEKNNSYSGSTVCNTGYNREDYSDRSFYSRVNYLGNPDIIFIFGCTNDAWANSPVGEFMPAGWSKKDMYAFYPAAACMVSSLKQLYPDAKIYYVLNTELKEEINEAVEKVCTYFDIPLIRLHDIDKQMGHPSVAGMAAISAQIKDFIDRQ